MGRERAEEREEREIDGGERRWMRRARERGGEIEVREKRTRRAATKTTITPHDTDYDINLHNAKDPRLLHFRGPPLVVSLFKNVTNQKVIRK